MIYWEGVPTSNCSTSMEPTGNRDKGSSKEETPLICGLPDDVALLCLARVPRTYHGNLRCVSKRWRALVYGEEWLAIRKKYNLEETWIYALCQDGFDWGSCAVKYACYVLDPYATRKCWKRIQDLPSCIEQRQHMNFEVLGTKAYLIGGCHFPEQDWSDPSDREVHCYDVATNSWGKIAPVLTQRCHLASEVLDGKIYAVGSGLLRNPDGIDTCEAYDPATNKWTAQPDPRVIQRSTESIVYNGKLFVRNSSDARAEARGAVYEPSTGTWYAADTDMVLGWRDPSVVADGRLYSFDQSLNGFNLTMWKEDEKKWVLVANLESFLEEVPYRLVAIGKSIFFVGNGLATIEVDISNVGDNGGGLLTANLTGPIYDDVKPISCKCMPI